MKISLRINGAGWVATALSCIAMLLLGGCRHSGTSEREAFEPPYPGLRRGMTAEQVDRHFERRGIHQFTASIDSREVLCLEYDLRLHCLFVDGALDRAVRPPEFEHEVAMYEGYRWEKALPVDPDRRLTQTLAAADLIGQASHPSTRPAKGGSGNLGPAVVILAPLYALATPFIIGQEHYAAAVAGRFNGRKARLGATPEEIAEVFGEPARVHVLSEGVRDCVYGQGTWVKEWTHPWFPWVCVRFEDGRATRAFSHGFLDVRRLP